MYIYVYFLYKDLYLYLSVQRMPEVVTLKPRLKSIDNKLFLQKSTKKHTLKTILSTFRNTVGLTCFSLVVSSFLPSFLCYCLFNFLFYLLCVSFSPLPFTDLVLVYKIIEWSILDFVFKNHY